MLTLHVLSVCTQVVVKLLVLVELLCVLVVRCKTHSNAHVHVFDFGAQIKLSLLMVKDPSGEREQRLRDL
jgi:hypothetical protein